MNQGFTFDQVVVLLGMCAAGIVFLGGVAIGIVRWVEGRFDRRDEAREEEKRMEDDKRERQMSAFEAALKDVGEAFKTELREDRDITKAAIDALHSRLSNARKEMVELRQYDKDLKRIEDGTLRVLSAIETLAASIRHDMKSQAQTVTNLAALQGQMDHRVKLVEDRQTAFINVLKPQSVGGAE